jgi:hypothetical protein
MYDLKLPEAKYNYESTSIKHLSKTHGFVAVSHFHPNLLFVGKGGILP